MIKITIDPSQAIEKTASAAAAIARAIMRAGAQALDLVASAAQQRTMAEGMNRTGTLANEIGSEEAKAVDKTEAGLFTGSVGIRRGSPAHKYAYLLTEQVKDIVPVNATALTIPIEDNLTGAGDASFPTVAALIAEFGDNVVFIGRGIGVRSGKRGDTIDWYFMLSGGVTVRGRDVLRPVARESTPLVREMIVEAITQELQG